MTILALEFSSPMRSVSVLPGKAISEGGLTVYAYEKEMRGIKPFALIDAALREVQLDRSAVDCVAVGLGPGSYAGIRIAIAIAQGWRMARGVKMAGFSSADCVAHQFTGEGPLTVVIDAQRNEFYGARYEKIGRAVRLVEPFRVMNEQDWQRQKSGEPFFRPDLLESSEGWHALPPKSTTLAQLAAGSFSHIRELPLAPIYLRPATFVKAAPPKFSFE